MCILEQQIAEMNAQVETSHAELEELKNLYQSSQDELASVMQSSGTKDNQLEQVSFYTTTLYELMVLLSFIVILG